MPAPSFPAKTQPAKRQITQETIPMKLTWYGHSAFRIEVGVVKILIDPFLSDNPSWKRGWEEPAQGVTHVLLTHGHNDHVGDALAILKTTDAMLVANSRSATIWPGRASRVTRSIPAFTAAQWTAAVSRRVSSMRCIPRHSAWKPGGMPISAIRPASSSISQMTRRSITWATPTSLATWR
jgi:glyoxylase-like metal-dependent hydrolase (beta-lactamase superfamily II)